MYVCVYVCMYEEPAYYLCIITIQKLIITFSVIICNCNYIYYLL